MSSSTAPAIAFEHVDVLVVGAGLTGIGMGHHLKTLQPDKTFAIVEAREAIGGTWDLFRYPGVRADVDLHTFGFGFKPWTHDNAFANGDEILDYLHETIDDADLGRHIHVGHRVVSASFSTEDSRWLVLLEPSSGDAPFEVTCSMLFSAAGYYDVDQGYAPEFEGLEDFPGEVVHPQHWPADLDYAGKKVVVIGSGATAVTMVPAMAETAGHVTMLQRSPSYVMPAPRQDPVANALRGLLPAKAAYSLTRAINIRKQNLLYGASRRFPKQMRALVRRINVNALPDGFDVDTHFNPQYAPWDQRMCVAPDADIFRAISDGAASVVTDGIVRFTGKGILLESGAELEADVIITATGLNMVPFGKIPLHVDGERVELHDKVSYKGLMVSDIPNFAFTVGYVNQAWTLKADLVAQWFCRLLAHMDRHGFVSATPVVDDPDLALAPLINMGTGYVNRAMHLFPQQGSSGPWRLDQDYKLDRSLLGKDPIEEAGLVFAAAQPSASVAGALTGSAAR